MPKSASQERDRKPSPTASRMELMVPDCAYIHDHAMPAATSRTICGRNRMVREIDANGPCFIPRRSVARARPAVMGITMKKITRISALTMGVSSLVSVKICT
ncbi:hypothetical protein BC477_05610 [Clavibacter michiganensis subsp. michiganensis]|uniref:Uncharacterized protein n=1 Tax=Clavibacter michiganensis subsp. michiganensis TaxID=33013 RepID=A0A251XL42_CLAMM|nr:hypothetical protein BC477_05610 [Clavibacter michiganensis subsp. michiganensis]OUE04194.1 hypothetical protein CMMCAS07_04540 [Clavibacter michiganensis subsp. michiganensis]